MERKTEDRRPILGAPAPRWQENRETPVGEVVFGAGGMRQHWAKDVEVVRGTPMMI